MTLHTDRLEIIPCPVSVAQAGLTNRQQASVVFGFPVPADWPLPDTTPVLEFQVERYANKPELLCWGIWLMVDCYENSVVGDIGFHAPPDAKGTVEIGYSVLPDYRRRGYATEAVRALVDWALQQDEVRRVVAECEPDNLASRRVLEKAGLKQMYTRPGTLLHWQATRGEN